MCLLFLLTADLQVRRLTVLSDGAACCAVILTGVCVFDIFYSKGGHASVTSYHHSSIQALDEKRNALLRKTNHSDTF